MISIVATLNIKDGQSAEFEALAKELAAAVNENEDGCEYYALHRTEDPHQYVFIERYRDEAAVEAHRASDHYRSVGARMGAHMAGRPDVQILQEVD